MDGVDLVLMFRWVKRVVGLVVVVGLLVAPVTTSQLVWAMIEKRADNLSERFTDALRPVLAHEGPASPSQR